MRHYSVRKLAKLAGVSVRTLHHYDRLGLLTPSVRTEARYRLYGEDELIRLQQILFYKELDLPLTEIKSMLDAPDFNLLTALQSHRQALEVRRDRLSVLLDTIDKTMLKLKGEEGMLTDEELYAGFPKEQAETYRREAVEKYGAQVVEESENKLRQMGKPNVEALKAESLDIAQSLARLRDADPASQAVQAQIARHYANIRQFWGNSVGNGNMAEAYKGLAQLYVDDLRYTASYTGHEDPAFATFLHKAMVYFADTQLAQ
ncbi:transcriptional regulator, MerR family [Fibrisoma limi BUZ 3]|uniref:Transcriptional regulator, MerR family n=1 Tax=Fibrisoma limi BUZ 3 TaxID=1185876 RepID=I2GQN0_9BACT|nr:MerR family transcriptional regulator [Fibrisoma limi]CCH56208.1 transcriptional regulator, MerR family [Fibrisoma limi BUZ 3]